MEYWLLAHLIGDYLIQNDWMAKNKKLSFWGCHVHCSTYLIPFLPLLANGDVTIFELTLIYIQHFSQDRTNFVKWFMDKTGKTIFSEPPLGPWSIIVCDNVFHISFLWVIFELLN